MMWNGAYMGKIKSAITVVCDAGPAIHLDELCCLDLLIDFQEVLDILKDMPLKTTLYIRHSLLQKIQLKIKKRI